MNVWSGQSVPSHIAVFRSIAVEAHARMVEADKKFRIPIPGQPGRHELRQDPERTSFKNGFIAHAFVGVTLEALLHIFGSRVLGVEVYASIEETRLEERLRRLGVVDVTLQADAVRFRRSRREFVHERALRPREDDVLHRTVQDEADHAIDFLAKLEAVLRAKYPPT